MPRTQQILTFSCNLTSELVYTICAHIKIGRVVCRRHMFFGLGVIILTRLHANNYPLGLEGGANEVDQTFVELRRKEERVHGCPNKG